MAVEMPAIYTIKNISPTKVLYKRWHGIAFTFILPFLIKGLLGWYAFVKFAVYKVQVNRGKWRLVGDKRNKGYKLAQLVTKERKGRTLRVRNY